MSEKNGTEIIKTITAKQEQKSSIAIEERTEDEIALENKENDTRIKNIYRGIWADELKTGDKLPIGGSIFRKELELYLELDFDAFEKELELANETRLKEAFMEIWEEKVVEYLQKLKCDLDPYLFYALLEVQRKVEVILGVEEYSGEKSFERSKLFSNENIPKLSDLVGKTACAERAAMGQYVLRKIGIEASYMSGIILNDIEDPDEFPSNHSFLILSEKGNKCLVFDIARSHKDSIPRIYSMETKLDYELFKDASNLLVCGEDVLSHSKLWFGVGEITAGKKQGFSGYFLQV